MEFRAGTACLVEAPRPQELVRAVLCSGRRALSLGSLDPAEVGSGRGPREVGVSRGRVTAPALTAGPRLSLESEEAESAPPDQVTHVLDTASHWSHGSRSICDRTL